MKSRRLIISALAICIATIQPAKAYSQTWKLKDFLIQFRQQNETLRRAAAQLQINEANARVGANRWKSSLSVNPNKTWQDQDFLSSTNSSSYQNESSELNSTISQTLPWGTSLAFKIQNSLERNNPALGGIDNQYTLSLNQPLWKNAFGTLENLEEAKQNYSLLVAQSRFQQNKLETCLKGVEIFGEAYTSQEIEKIYSQILNSAEEVLKIAESAYRKKLLRTIDYLEAKADFLRIQGLKLEADRQLSSNLVQVLTYHPEMKDSGGLVLADPSSFFVGEATTQPQWESHPLHQTVANQLLQQQQAVAQAKNSSRAQFDLILAAGTIEGRVESGATLLEYDEMFYKAGVQWTLPLGDVSLDANLNRQKAELQIAEANLSAQRRTWHESLESLKAQHASSGEQLSLSTRKVQLYEKQLTEAFRLLRAGKLEFNDFIRYQDQLLNEKITRTKLQKALWLSWSQWQLYNQNIPLLCGEA